MKKLSVLLAALALAGCAGTSFDWSRAKQVQVGTTEAELVAIMGGKPYMVKTQGDNQLWVWSYADGWTGSVRAVSFPIKNGAVASLPTIPF